MLQRECLPSDAAETERLTCFDGLPLRDRIAPDSVPGLRGGIDGTGNAIGKSASMIGVCVRQHDGRWPQRRRATEPIGTAVQQDPRFSTFNQQRAVPAMARGSQLDFTAGAEELQVDLSNRHHWQGALNS